MIRRHRPNPNLNRLILAALVILGALPAVAETPAALHADPGYPRVHFSYHFVPFDRACSELAGQEIPKEWIDELESQADAFRQTWEEDGPRLLEAVVAETGKPFRQREMIAVMSLCKFPSMSHPLLLNMRRFLDAPTEGKPNSKALFSALVLHELLHTYVVDHLEDSRIDAKYKDEPGSVRSHIHLMALMKTVYEKLGRPGVLEQVIARDAKIGPIYTRAWEIVNKVEGAEALVEELRRPREKSAPPTSGQ